MNKKLNIGCGDDYREGFINIDGSDTLKRIDKVIKIPEQKIASIYDISSIDYILCNDFIEHHYHFEAIEILKDFYNVLKEKGQLEIRVPDSNYIIINPFYSFEKKLTLLFGGQDVPQGNLEMDKSRKKYPEFFCHKYGWNKERIIKDLKQIGFTINNIKRVGTNIVVKAIR